jgi:hypothetical protein
VNQKTKNVALEKFLEENALKPCDFCGDFAKF